ncbi:MAG: SDR family NAD(P)-dependent oxidoreductase [Chloroflexi bacterium]|nr:SDR family NAD(P)-dependent oxidoreductase [Chloroflexota bacterium]
MRLDGQVAIVTGAGTGIGRATAVAFASRGARVVLVGRRRASLEETAATIVAAGGQVLPCPADLTDPAAADQLVAETLATWGAIDVLVNNADINVPVRDLADVSIEDWKAVIDADLPQRAAIDLILIRPTVLRDVSEDRRRVTGGS